VSDSSPSNSMDSHRPAVDLFTDRGDPVQFRRALDAAVQAWGADGLNVLVDADKSRKWSRSVTYMAHDPTVGFPPNTFPHAG
jgi:hypothetical protein